MPEEALQGRNDAVRLCLSAQLAKELGPPLNCGEKIKTLKSKSRSTQIAVWVVRRQCQWHMRLNLCCHQFIHPHSSHEDFSLDYPLPKLPSGIWLWARTNTALAGQEWRCGAAGRAWARGGGRGAMQYWGLSHFRGTLSLPSLWDW